LTRGAATNARIFLVDDHEVVREGLKFLLSNARSEWEVCGEAANAEDAIKQVQSLKPDIILLDISMPGTSGLEAAPKMRKLDIRCPILVFTTHQSERLGDDVRRCGAQGFVLKTQAFRDLVYAIDVLLAGGAFFGSPFSPEGAPEKPDSGGRSFCVALRFAWQFELPYLSA
jgi:two-component system, NarL family, nitrate/nitrite response regulator NarL